MQGETVIQTVTETESSLSVGRRFGRYTLVRPIGRGGMAEIWKARIHGPRNFQRQVVVKRILPHLCLDPELVDMFTAEAMLSGQLNHANIVQVFEFAEEQGELYLAMEYVQGVNLAELLKRLDGVPIPVGMAAYLVRDLALALGYAHALTDEEGRSLSIIHRDVSPSNVMVGYDGSVKLVDFGVAQARVPTVSPAPVRPTDASRARPRTCRPRRSRAGWSWTDGPTSSARGCCCTSC
jgi:serine/threonine-protein kinase